MTEIWRDIPGWEGYYQVSDHGRVKSLSRVITMRNGVPRPVPERILIPTVTGTEHQKRTGKGYPSVCLARDAHAVTSRINRLVLAAFRGEPPTGHVGCHRNGDTLDNSLNNLYWGTLSENQQDSIAHGTNHRARKTSCHRGHLFTPENTYLYPDGSRDCMTCRRNRLNDWKLRARQKDQASRVIDALDNLAYPEDHS